MKSKQLLKERRKHFDTKLKSKVKSRRRRNNITGELDSISESEDEQF